MVPIQQCFANNVPPNFKNRYLCTAEFLNCVQVILALHNGLGLDTPTVYKTDPGVSRYGIGPEFHCVVVSGEAFAKEGVFSLSNNSFVVYCM